MTDAVMQKFIRLVDGGDKNAYKKAKFSNQCAQFVQLLLLHVLVEYQTVAVVLILNHLPEILYAKSLTLVMLYPLLQV